MLISTVKFMGRVVLGSMAIVLGCQVALAGDGPPSASAGPDAEQPKILQSYDLAWYSVDGGGGTSAGGSFTLTGAIGQPDVGVSRTCGTALSGGVWSGAEPCEPPVFCDGFESGDTGAWSLVSP